MQKAWNFTWDNFFCDKMNLFYDYLVNEFEEINGKHVLLKQVKGLDKDISIIGCTDWDSVISIYIACGQQWASGLVENSLYLNSGSDKMYKRPCNHSINKLINELNEHSNNVTVENDVIIDLNIIHNGVRTEHRLGV